MALLLLAMAIGYGVLVLANKQERPLDVLGRIIGGIMLLISVGGLLCIASSRFCKSGKASCGMMDKAACGFMAKDAPAAEAAPPAK